MFGTAPLVCALLKMLFILQDPASGPSTVDAEKVVTAYLKERDVEAGAAASVVKSLCRLFTDHDWLARCSHR